MSRFQSLLVLSIFLTLTSANTFAFEMLGLISYDISSIQNKPSNYGSTQNGLGYNFFGRIDLGPGKLESGFMYAPAGVTTHEASLGDVKMTGSYWIIPLIYRYSFYEPFFSLGVGFDYAAVGNTALTVNGAPYNIASNNSGYQSHFGAEISGEATQDLGENLSAVLDVRYRMGLSNGITFLNLDPTVTSAQSKYNFFMIAIGLQKRLD